MTHTLDMMRTNPAQPGIDETVLARCVDACFDCAQTCTACADACLGESDPSMLVRCIAMDLNCAAICVATGQVATRETVISAEGLRPMLEACAALCRLCAEECESHADMHQHCKVCAEACRQCEAACAKLLTSLTTR